MKKKNYCLFLSGAALLMLAGCTADEQSWIESGQVPVQLTVSQDVSGDVTRTTSDLHTATTGFAVDETMKIFMKTSSGTSSQVYKVASVSSGTATLTDNGTKLYYPTGTSGSVQLYAVYPSDITQSSSHTVAYDQTGDANYRSSDLMYSAAKTVNLSDKTTQQALNNFEHQMVRLKLNIIKASNVTSVTKVVMNSVKRKVTVNTLNESTISLSAAAQATGETSGTGNNLNEIQIFSGTNSSTSQQTYYVVFPKQVTSGNDWDGTDFITVTADGATATYTLTKAFTAGRQYELTLNINAAALNNTVAITGWTDTQSATVNPTKEVDNAPDGVKLVDLNLYVGGGTSGTKLLWANMNVGATTETGYGTYFAWGETSGYTEGGTNIKTYYSWTTYAWCQNANNNLTKYCPADKQSDYWFDTSATNVAADNKTELDLGDDAARANWGGKWRMPTQAELEALANTKDASGYSWTWCDGSTEKYNGSSVKGWKITCTATGGTLFLPAAGYRYDSSFYGQGSYGNYWSSTLDADDPSHAYSVYFGSSLACVLDDYRYYGFTVRAVQSE